MAPQEMREGGSAAKTLPLAVDMDGTLLRTDVLVECIVAALVSHPLGVLAAIPLLFTKGRAAFKARIHGLVPLKVDHLPVRSDLLAFLHEEKARGRALHLVTAGEGEVAARVAARFGIFDAVHGSDGETNLKGTVKLARLQALFPGGFAYAGDSRADLKVWSGAEGVVLAGASSATARKARQLGKPVEAEFADESSPFRVWRKALRMHQWSKNGLIFVPFLLGAHLHNLKLAVTCVLGFLFMGVAASATYLINDLADLEADRRHRSKSRRPLASGALPVATGLVAAPAMLLFALAGMTLLSPAAAVGLCAYIVITLAYSFKLKRLALFDAVALGALYTLRLIIGTLLAASAFSPWLLTFSVFFFFSMSLAKRHVEVTAGTGDPNVNLPGRGYRPSDAPLTLGFGAAASTAAVLIMVQYMMAEAFPSGVYARPIALWAAPLLVGLWICRIWLLAHRGDLDDDPVAFAVRDKVSLAFGAILGVAFLIAR